MKFTPLILFCLPFQSIAAVQPVQIHKTGSFDRNTFARVEVRAAIPDSTVRPPHTSEEFMLRYGTNDTSKAIIRFYFFKAKGYRNFSWLPLLFAAPFTIIFLLLASNDPLKNNGARDGVDMVAIFGILAFLSLCAAIPWSIINVIRYRNFRKKLITVLERYAATGTLSRRISRSTLFRVALRGEPAVVPWKQPKPAPRAIRERKPS